MSRRVLVVAPHPDDEAIGCGGAIGLHRQQGDRVAVLFLTSGELATPHLPREEVWAVREAEARRASRILDVNHSEFLRLPDQGVGADLDHSAAAAAPFFESIRPDRVYLPHPADSHPDHRACWPLVQRVWEKQREDAPRPECWGYEVWTPMSESPCVRPIDAVMDLKLRAVRCYASQLELVRYDRAVRGLNQYRGVMALGHRYGEAFLKLELQADETGRNQTEENASGHRPEPRSPVPLTNALIL